MSNNREADERLAWLKALAKADKTRGISWDDSDQRPDADCWSELVWLSCDEDGDSLQEQRDMCTFLDSLGVLHENTAVPPEFWGYSEYTPAPGWVMKIRVNLMDTRGFTNELKLAREAVETRDELINWRRLSHDYSAELKEYAKCVHSYADHECDSPVCEFVRAAYMKSPDLYDKKPGEFPRRPSSGFASTMKAFYPLKELERLCERPIGLFSALNKGPK